MRTTLLISLALCFGTLRASDKDSVAVAHSVATFVTAFNNFDWTTFRESFDEDASMFHPTWENARRIRGRKN